MGTEYYFINKENKTFYNLGKGGWYILSDELSAVTYDEYLEELLYGDIFRFSESNEEPENRKFCKELANDLIKFVNGADPKNLIIISDEFDDSVIFKGLGYRCVGSRYVNESEKLDNRHLNEHRHIYNLERMINKHIYATIGNTHYPINKVDNSHWIALIEKYGGKVSQDENGIFLIT